LALPLGRLRLRGKGSDGGHKGLRSISQHLGSTEFARLRLGIGQPQAGDDPVDYVLSPFTAEEKATAEEMVVRATDCIELFLRAGLAAAMDLFNRA